MFNNALLFVKKTDAFNHMEGFEIHIHIYTSNLNYTPSCFNLTILKLKYQVEVSKIYI